MRPPRLRLPAQLTLAALLAAALLPFLPTPAFAASGVSMTVHTGYQDVFKTGMWAPVTIDARNTGAPLDGTLQVQEVVGGQNVLGLALYQQPLSLASGATKRIRLYVEIDATAGTVNVRLVQAGRVIASQDSVPASSTADLIGVLSDQPATLDAFAAVHPASVAARVVHLRPEDLPDSAIPLRAFDILAIDDFASDGLTVAQRAALTDFVNLGGNLLIGTGAAWHKTLAGLPAGLLPMQVTGTTLIDTATTGGSAVEVATGSITSGRPWLDQNGQPLLLERAVGAGTVTMATFDWNQPPVAVASSLNPVLRQVVSRALFSTGLSGGNYPYPVGGIGGGPVMVTPYGTSGATSIAAKSAALSGVLGNLPGLDLPSLQLTAALVLLYVIIVGPLNYLVLGALHRRALAWVTVPAIAVLAAGGAYGTGVVSKGRSVQLNQVAVVHIQPGWDRGYQENYDGVIPPSRGDYVATIDGNRFLISPVASYGPTPPSLRIDLQSNAITLGGMTAFSAGGFADEGLTGAPKLTANLQLVNGTLVGTVQNQSSLTFTDAVLIIGNSYQQIPELKPGGTFHLSLTPTGATGLGQAPLYIRIYGNNQGFSACGPYGGPCGPAGNSAADREAATKSGILSILPSAVGFKGMTTYTSPMLVAWTHQSFQNVTVNGSQPRVDGLSAVVLSLPVDQIGTGSLPAGVTNSRIVDVVGDNSGNGPPGMLSLQNGSVTYEFAPPLAAGTHLTGAALTSQNFFGAPGSPNGPSLQGQAWDWTTSSWTDISYVNNGTTALPDTAVNPQSGLIRVRISSSGGAYLAGSLSLTGTVQ